MLGNTVAFYGFYVSVALAIALLANVVLLSAFGRLKYKRLVNRRLTVLDEGRSRNEALVLLRKSRGLSADGRYTMPIVWFNRLVLQSGISVSISKFLIISAGPVILSFGTSYLLTSSWLIAIAVALIFGVIAPLALLWILRARRRSLFESQLPDAIDVVVRSLKAGHPVPVAISMVAREMPDPIGSEFGITADETTYGLDLQEAMRNMVERVGQMDLSLVAVAVSIQMTSGGNLSEILSVLSGVIRQRFKLKRKIRALSAEGRCSAIILGLLPFVLLMVMFITAPKYYGDVWGNPMITYGLYASASLTIMGHFVMYRIVNFKF